MEIKYKDVKDFLEEQGYNWNNVLMINNGKTLRFVKKLQNLEDEFSLMHIFVEPRFGNIKQDQKLRADVGLTHFTVFAKDEHKGFNIGNSIDSLWVEFLLKRYKKQYADEVKNVSNTIINNLIAEHDKSLIQMAIQQRKLEDRAEQTYLRAKKENLSIEEYASAMSDYQTQTALMIANSARLADERNYRNRELARKLCGFDEIKERISSFGY